MSLFAQLEGLAQKMTPSTTRGRVYMVVPVSSSAGASVVSAQLAKFSAQSSGRPVWLFDLDLQDNIQAKRAPLNGHILSAELGGRKFWDVEPAQSARMAMRRVEGLPVYISQFQYKPGTIRGVQLKRDEAYWNNVRAVSALTLVDVPHDFEAAQTLYPDMDGVILVVDAQQTKRSAANEFADMIEAAGGRVMGVVINRAPMAQ